MLKNKFDFILRLLIALCMATSCHRLSSSQFIEVDQPKQTQAVEAENSILPELDMIYEIKSFDQIEQAVEAAAQISNQGLQNQKQTTIISTESLEFLNEIYRNKNFDQSLNESTFIIHNDSVAQFSKNTVTYIKNGYKNDKIGFIVATYTTAMETIMWIHVAPMSTIAITANVAFTIGMALYFKINKDKWTEVTQKIKTPLRQFFNMTNEKSKSKNLILDYIANLGLSLPLTLIRVPLMSMNTILEEGISLKLIEKPLLLSIIGTASFFTWSEHLGGIDKKTHPISKFVFQRASELRSVMVATFASTAALLTTDGGMAPWITLSVVGLTGAVLYLNGKQITDWIETSPAFNKIKSLAHLNSSGVLACHKLFQ